MRPGLADARAAAGAGARDDRQSAARARRRAPRATCPRSSPSARSPTGAAPSASRALFDKTLYEFLYHYWFRVEVEGIEHVPSTGGALLVSNHAGALPPDAAMIAKAIKDEHAAPAPAAPDRRALLQGLSGPVACSSPSSAACPRTRPTCTACSTTRSSSCSSSRRAARAPRSSTRTATGCGASAAAASSSRRCAPARRSSRSRSSAPRRRCRSSPRSACCRSSPG